MINEILRLDNQICFPLYAVNKEMTKRYRPLLEELNVTYPQYLVLLVLWESGEMSVKELGERLFLDSGTLTPMLKRMEENEFIARNRSKGDERVVNVTLTEQGEQAREKATKIPLRFLEQTNLNEEELMQLKRILAKMLKNSE
ncbi:MULTISPECIES: MarR family winged helix-turn-helix transcriptional regulator [Shouchella]|uniref:HTH-type transcriptional regulator SarZ n=2 Tax=Shouchella TaxID=2893057 RepID=A0ABY7WD98_9BACI|nr:MULTISPECIES: MarR family transcriptional regulator [Shouchella]MED4128809.1 MarR family transcriptional regulator [Shouchella miscanthi]WDF05830.1 MarR family transcriptional regulator [Shouchella hunanensis]